MERSRHFHISHYILQHFIDKCILITLYYAKLVEVCVTTESLILGPDAQVIQAEGRHLQLVQ